MSKFLFIALIFHTSLCANSSWYSFIVFWNVGQGQWVTAVSPDQCVHFDFGGEIYTLTRNRNLFLKLCRQKLNILHLSHADLDHYAFYSWLVRSTANICWFELDHTAIPLKRVTRKIPLCPRSPTPAATRLFKPGRFSNRNDSSKVYVYNSVLIPGDSSQKQEKNWVKSIKNPQKIKVLLLGHHGSRTSSGEMLLAKLTQLKMAIVQARKEKFNHPHEDIVQRLEKHRVPLLRVEDWGTTALIFE